MPWQRIVSATENTAQSHETLAAKIQADVETPLRQYSSTNREIQSMGNMSGNLAAIAKDITNAQKKTQKLDAKGGTKAENARSDLDDATNQWETQAPFVFEQLQALDEARVNHLRDVLTQFQTHELDSVEKGRTSAESCLNALLNVETADEIRTFAARAKGQAGTTPASRRESMPSSSRPAGMNIPPTPPPPRNTHLEQRNSSVSGQDTLAPLPEPLKEKKLSGLKRLGTVMGRRKSAMPPPPPGEKKKEKTRSFAPFRRQESSRSFQDLESSGQDLSPAISRDERASSRHDSERPPQTQESRISEASFPPAVNGVTRFPPTSELEDRAQPPPPQISANQEPLIPETRQNTLSPPTIQTPEIKTTQPDPFAQAMDTTASPGEEPARNFEIKDQPIPEDESAAQMAMNNMASQLRMQAQSTGLNRVQGSVRGRRDVRNTMFFPSPQELPSPGTPNLGAPSTPASATTVPTIATSTTGATSTSASDLVAPVKRSLGTGTIPEDASHVTSDTQSITSAHSMAGVAHHQEMHAPGLNASIVETVNSWFSDEGVSRSSVVGEIALAHNRSSSTTAPDHDIVRLQNFHQLEKCAQNPQFVTASTSDNHQPGTYNVALSSISRSIPTVGFKYQLHMDESNLSSFSPLLVTQAWQIVEGQASVILLYSLNPAFAPVANLGSSPNPPPQELTLRNVVVTVSLDTKPTVALDAPSPKAISAQMMPVQNAHFKKRSSAVSWRFPELTVKTAQERLLVRFMIENNGTARKGGIDVKFEAHNMLGSALGVERLVTESNGTTPAADPFADEDDGARKSAEAGQRWEDVQSRKLLVSGKYSVT